MNRTNKIFFKITAVYIHILLPVFLFFCGTRGYQALLSAKFPAFCVICGGYVLVMAALGIECVLIGAVKPASPLELLRRSSPAQRLVLLYLALTWASAVLSPCFPETVLGVSRYEGALTITIYVLCFLLVSVFGRVTARTLAVLGASAALFSGLCLLQLAGYNPLRLYPAGYGYADAYTAYSGAYLGTIGNVDLVAAFLCLAIPPLWVGLVRLKGKRRFLLLIPLALSLAVLVKMSVLAGLAGVFGGGALMLPAVLPLRPGRRALAAGLLAAAIVLCGALVYMTDFPPGPLQELHRVLHGDWDSTFGSGRIHIWRGVLERVPSQLWFGSGPDTMLRAGIEPFTRYDEGLGRTIVSRIDVAHNEYLNILFHQGVFALAAYLLVLARAGWNWIRYSPADPACAMLGGAVLCYCVQAFFGFSMCITAPFFWLALGLLENRLQIDRQGEKLCGKNS